MTVKNSLRECQVFSRLTDSQLGKLAALCSKEVYEAGTTIFNSGDTAERLFVLEEGKIALQLLLPVKQSELRKRITVDIIAKNELFGWSGMSEPYIYSLSAICLQRATVLAVNASKMSSVLQDDYAIAYEVLYGLVNVVSVRLHDTTQLLVTERSLV